MAAGIQSANRYADDAPSSVAVAQVGGWQLPLAGHSEAWWIAIIATIAACVAETVRLPRVHGFRTARSWIMRVFLLLGILMACGITVKSMSQVAEQTRPDGAGVSSLEHVLAGAHTISPDRGLFLEETWRLHPSICRFNSELFYDKKLQAVAGCDGRRIDSKGVVQDGWSVFLSCKEIATDNNTARVSKMRSASESRPHYIVKMIVGG